MLRGAEALSCALSTRWDRGKGMTLTTMGEGGRRRKGATAAVDDACTSSMMPANKAYYNRRSGYGKIR